MAGKLGEIVVLMLAALAVSEAADDQDTPPLISNDKGAENNSTGKHVRCYCNLPNCITSGYMCKSPSGGCFSKFLPDVNQALHGCIETQENGNHNAKCMNSSSEIPIRISAGAIGVGQVSASFVHCCFRDLCNHADSPQLLNKFNETGAWGSNIGGSNTIASPGAADNHTNEIWFRAATIAVPIFGALILFILIAVAIKILRNDALDAANKLNASYSPHGVGQGSLEAPLMKKGVSHRESVSGLQSAAAAPLLFNHNNVINICETNPKKNELSNKVGHKCDCKEENCVNIHYPPILQHSSPIRKMANPKHYNKDVNVNVVPSKPNGNETKCVNSKVYEKQLLPLNDKLYNKETILCWGQAAANANNCPR